MKGGTSADFRPDGSFIGLRDDGNKEWVVSDFTAKSSDNKSFVRPLIYQLKDKTDINSLRAGIVKEIIPVIEIDILSMMVNAGAFDPIAKKSPIEYLAEHSFGRDLDFSMAQIGDHFNKSTPDSRAVPTVLFVIMDIKIAFNHYNFGNFLWGASAYSLMPANSSFIIRMGAHANSLKRDGEFDSSDDQDAISRGYKYALSRHYHRINAPKPFPIDDLNGWIDF